MKPPLMDMAQVAEQLGVTKNTLYAWVSQRRITIVKVGRLVKFDQRDIDEWIDKNKIKAVAID